MSFVPFFLQAAATGAAGSTPATGAAGGGFGMLIPLLLIVLIMYFFMIRPQNKKQKETEKMIAALKKGDKVVTIGGIHGVISSTKENTVIVKVDDGAKIEFNRSAIATVITDKPAVEAPKEEKKGLFGFGKKAKKEETSANETKADETAENAQAEEAQAESAVESAEEKKDE